MNSCDQEQPNTVPFHVRETKQWRKDLDAVLQQIKLRSTLQVTSGTFRQMTTEELEAEKLKDKPEPVRCSRERSLTITKLQEAIMWLGMDLKDQDAPNPYPQSYNPRSPRIEPTADGLKL